MWRHDNYTSAMSDAQLPLEPRPVIVNGDHICDAATRDEVMPALFAAGPTGDVVTFRESDDAFILQALHPTAWQLDEGRIIAVPGYELAPRRVIPSSSMEEGDAA